MHKDDIPGYLMDDISAWLDENDIKSMEDYYEKHQSDSFVESIPEIMDEIVKAVLEYRK